MPELAEFNKFYFDEIKRPSILMVQDFDDTIFVTVILSRHSALFFRFSGGFAVNGVYQQPVHPAVLASQRQVE